MAKPFMIRGSYEYRGKNIPYDGLINLNGENFEGQISDKYADCLVLSCRGTLKHQGNNVLIQLEREALSKRFPQNTLSDPMIFNFSRVDDGNISGEYLGDYRFAQPCSNLIVDIDEDGEKAIRLIEDTNTTGKSNIRLEQFV